MFQTFVLKRNFDGMGSIAAVMVPFLSKLIPVKMAYMISTVTWSHISRILTYSLVMQTSLRGLTNSKAFSTFDCLWFSNPFTPKNDFFFFSHKTSHVHSYFCLGFIYSIKKVLTTDVDMAELVFGN